MGTPFISLLEPGKLEGFKLGCSLEEQPATLPKTFLDVMEVRQEVFVKEQNVPLENEFDSDDPRSCHWVVYASINKTEELEVRDEEGNIVQPRKSTTRTTPIGTIRLVPFPHEPHPKADGKYWNGVLYDDEEGEKEAEPQEGETSATTYGTDRPTTFHDGTEPYVKLGRLAVIKEFRRHGIGSLLVNTVLGWLKSNPSFFDPSLLEMGLEQMGATSERDIPKWNGLACVHAQTQVEASWAKWGFQTDHDMSTWWEEGLPHIGMFQRLDIDKKHVKI